MSFSLDNLPFGAVVDAEGRQHAVVRFDDAALDLVHLDADLFGTGTLDALLAAGRERWVAVRRAAAEAITADRFRLLSLADVRPVLAFTPADYVDFYASVHHATNAGRIFRPDAPSPLTPNWHQLPIGYHGRSGSLRVSGEGVVRPNGILGPGEAGPSTRLDYEAELAFVVGVPGSRIPIADADDHIFGVCLLNDWSARDIQRFETQPLGPFLGKSFATTLSPWITTLDTLRDHRCAPAQQDPRPVSHLRDPGDEHGLDLVIEVEINGMPVSRGRYAETYWTYAQMLTHLTSNGSSVRTGDVFASGTISGATPAEWGSLLEIGWNGTRPVTLRDGSERCWLLDGDEVTVSGHAGELSLGSAGDTVRSG